MAVSVVLTTYSGDEPLPLQKCFKSLCDQDYQPDEVVIVRDKNLPSSLVEVIRDFEERSDFQVYDIEVEERGRGHARRVGVNRANSEFIAIIDADDIAKPDRIREQLNFLSKNPAVDLVGGYIEEFGTDSNQKNSIRKVPTGSEKIRRMAYYRNPINHPTIMFRRNAVVEVGNYKNLEYGEDYELICRLLSHNKTVRNLPKVLVKARATSLIERRKGWNIACQEVQLQREIVETGFYNTGVAFMNLLIRVPLRFLPKNSLQTIYRQFFRSGRE